METKFTTGPWKYLDFECEEGGEVVYGQDTCKRPIAEAIFWDDQVPREEAKANARLIAAAPELFEALVGMVDQFTKTPSTLKDTQARVKAHAAIRKATGEQA